MKPVLSIGNCLINLGLLNRRLADEVAKLPEIRKFRTFSSCLALSNLLKIYQFASGGFDHLFESVDEIGMPLHRNYCAPLQALFWLIQDEKIGALGDLFGLNIEKETDENGNCRLYLMPERESTDLQNDSTRFGQNCTLDRILNAAWNDERLLMQRKNIHQIINRIQVQSEAEEYTLLVKRHDDLHLQSYIMDDFLRKPKIFDGCDWQQIQTAINTSRWKIFFTVADRLNSPELVSYYINKKLSFRKTQANGVYFTFFDKKAQCTDAAYFAQFMLKRAGYNTFMRSVKWDDNPWDGLHTGAGIILEDRSYLLVSNYTGINSISGPFARLESLDQKLSCGRKIIGRKWGAYYPPRYY